MSRKATAMAVRVLTAKNIKDFSRIYRAAVKDSENSIIDTEFYKAIQSGSVDYILEVAGMPQFGAKMTEVISPVTSSFITGANQAFGEVPKKKQKTAKSIDLSRPFIKQYINDHTAAAVTNITEDTRQALQRGVEQVLRTGNSYRSMAEDMKKFIGLTIPQQNTLERLRLTLINNRLNQEQIDKTLEKRRQAMIKTRAEMIGRTESFNAISAGRQGMWSQFAKDGTISEETLRVWYTSEDERTCRICAPMHNTKAGINEPFKTGDGRFIISPTAHPNCRCTVILDL